MKNIPRKIYLQIDPENEKPKDFKDLVEVTWCQDKINDTDIEYELAKKNDFVLIEVLSEVNMIAVDGLLPDGDSVNVPTHLWAENAIRRIKDAGYTIKLFKDKIR